MASFPSAERLKSKLAIEEVYNKGELLKAYPLKLKYLKMDFSVGAKVQIVISIPKRVVKNATDRNRIRRQLQAVYRENKSCLLNRFSNEEKGLALFLIYSSKEKQTFGQLEIKLKELISKLEENL